MDPRRFTLIRSNDQSRLLDQLAARLRNDYAGRLFATVPLIVRNSRMKEYVIRTLAERYGIAANLTFHYPENLAGLFPGDAFVAFNDQTRCLLALEIHRILSDPDFLQRLLGIAVQSPVARYSMATGISRQLLNAAHYNPDLFLRGSFSHARLRMLWEKIQQEKRFLFAHEVFLNVPENLGDILPKRFYVFGIPFLSGFEYLSLALIAKYSEIVFFQQTPTREYWLDATAPSPVGSANHELLRYFGAAQKQFERKLMLANIYDSAVDEFCEVQGDRLLNRIQRDLLANCPVSVDSEPDAADRSLRIHDCPDVFREAETVYREILQLLNNSDLQPADIAIVVPEVSVYKACIADVFRQNPENIRVNLSDMSAFTSGEMYQLLVTLLTHPVENLTGKGIVNLLRFSAVCSYFSLDRADVETVTHFFEAMPVYEPPGEVGRENRLDDIQTSLRTFRRRLVFGFLTAPERGRLLNGVLPFTDLQGTDAPLLGKLLRLLDELIAVASPEGEHSAFVRRTPGEWALYAETVCCRLADPGETNEARHFRDIMQTIRELDKTANPFHIERSVFLKLFEQLSQGVRFFSNSQSGNAVEVLSLQRIRGVPFEAVFMMGMNETYFPGNAESDFDPFFGNSLHTDPDIRENRLYSLPAGFINARRQLHLSYVGQDHAKGYDLPMPFHLQIIANLAAAYYPKDADRSNANPLRLKHPINSFDPLYFSGNPEYPCFSERHQALAGKFAKALEVTGKAPAETYSDTPDFDLPAVDQTYTVDLEHWLSFFADPLKTFATKRLGIRNRFPGAGGNLTDNIYEPFLPAYRAERLVDKLTGEGTEQLSKTKYVKQILKAAGDYPRGAVGDYHLHRYLSHKEQVYGYVAALDRVPVQTRVFQLFLHKGPITCTVSLRGGYLFEVYPRVLRYRHMVRFYLRHLFLCASGKSNPSYLFGLNETEKPPILLELMGISAQSALEKLETLATVFAKGMQQPLCIFCHAAGEIMLSAMNKKYTARNSSVKEFDAAELDTQTAKKSALIGQALADPAKPYPPFDAENYYVRLFYGALKPLPITFVSDFTDVCLPIIEALTPFDAEEARALCVGLFPQEPAQA